MTRTERWDHEAERDMSLSLSPMRGAHRPPHHTLAELSQLIVPGATVAVSDMHGQPELFERVLGELGLVAEGRRVRRDVTLLQIGDLIDGRAWTDDMVCLGLARLCDRVILGNHEACLMGAGAFHGQPAAHLLMDLTHGLFALAEDGVLVAAHSDADVLYTHAGACAQHFPDADDPSPIVAQLNEAFAEYLARRHARLPGLYAVGHRRGGTYRTGGVLWADWAELLSGGLRGMRQVVGHTPSGSCERSDDERLVMIDTAGARAGVSVQLPDGRLLVGSDLVYRDRPAARGGCPTPADSAA